LNIARCFLSAISRSLRCAAVASRGHHAGTLAVMQGQRRSTRFKCENNGIYIALTFTQRDPAGKMAHLFGLQLI
jgi:hypothetical protein